MAFPNPFATTVHAGRTRAGASLALLVLSLSMPASAQAPLRCDLQLTTTPGAGAGSACLDLPALQQGGQPVQTAANATRISRDGFRLCKNAFTVSTGGEVDVVFIYDNSGSMLSHYAKIDAATNDTNFYHANGCGNNPATTGSLTYNTATGPKTVALVAPATNCQATSFAGDPYNSRAQVVRQAIDYLTQTSPNSTAAAVAFARDTAHGRPPLPLSVPGNADLVKASVVMDSIPNTYYAPPLRAANAWLGDTSLTNTQKKAIVFISDGAPEDNYNSLVGSIPIYSIFLGDSSSRQYASLQAMSSGTGGQFYRVDPGNLAGMNAVMQSIIQLITVVNLPQAVEITNASTQPPMVSRSTGMTRNADSSLGVVMDSILALVNGENRLTVKVTMTGSDVRLYPVMVRADGPVAETTSEELVCVAQPKLELLNQQGGADASYPSDAVKYDVKLTRTTSDLAQVVVEASSRDTTKAQPWGDRESIVLDRAGVSGTTTTNLKEDYDVNGSVAAPAPGNGALESAPNGSITLTWTHPRDARETASLTLPGRRIPVTAGFIDMVRLTDVPKGNVATLPVVIADPVVIRGGATFTKDGTTATLAHKGSLHNPHGLADAALDPNQVPTFVVKTASSFAYEITIFDHFGHFLNGMKGAVDSLQWERMRGNADSLAVALSILPVTRDGQRFGTGAYILKAVLTTRESARLDPGKPAVVTTVARQMLNKFGYAR